MQLINRNIHNIMNFAIEWHTTKMYSPVCSRQDLVLAPTPEKGEILLSKNRQINRYI